MTGPDPPAAPERVLAVGGYELWFIAQLTFGLVYLGGAMFLLPPFVLSLQGSTPGDVGVVMAVLPLIALGAPIVAGLLERFQSFRVFQLLGLGLLVVGFLILSIVDELIGATLGALTLGLAAAFLLTTNLSLLAGSGLPADVVSSRMSLLQMSIPLGQFLGLLVVAGLLFIELGFAEVFLVMAGLAALGLLGTALTSGPAEARARAHTPSPAPAPPDDAPGPRSTAQGKGLAAVLLSSFGLVLLVLFLSNTALGALESQYANYMSDVFKVDGEVAALALAVAVLLSVPVFPLVGRWLARAPYRNPLLLGSAVRAGAGVILWLISDVAGIPPVIPLALYGSMLVVLPLVNVSGSLLANATSPIGTSGGQGAFAFAEGAAAVAGAFIAGWVASEFGYAQVALVVILGAGAATGLALLLPTARADKESEGVTT